MFISFITLAFLLSIGVTPAFAKDKKPAKVTKFTVTPATSSGTSDVKVSLKINEKAYVKISIYKGSTYITGNKKTKYKKGTVKYTWKTAKGIIKEDGTYTVKVNVTDLAKNKTKVKPKTFKIDNTPTLVNSSWTYPQYNPANGTNVLNYTASEDVFAMLVIESADSSLGNILFSCDIELPIYSRTGSITWDGTLYDLNDNSLQAPPGAYTYTLVLFDKINQQSVFYTGTVTITQ